uniref:Uncharacterized protein n=1 Tax=Arundo donax TaxID=35708 RepID=A0A0A9DEC7_ARUDO
MADANRGGFGFLTMPTFDPDFGWMASQMAFKDSWVSARSVAPRKVTTTKQSRAEVIFGASDQVWRALKSCGCDLSIISCELLPAPSVIASKPMARHARHTSFVDPFFIELVNWLNSVAYLQRGENQMVFYQVK